MCVEIMIFMTCVAVREYVERWLVSGEADRRLYMKFLNEILGIKYPFIQGGMANIATG